MGTEQYAVQTNQCTIWDACGPCCVPSRYINRSQVKPGCLLAHFLKIKLMCQALSIRSLTQGIYLVSESAKPDQWSGEKKQLLELYRLRKSPAKVAHRCWVSSYIQRNVNTDVLRSGWWVILPTHIFLTLLLQGVPGLELYCFFSGPVCRFQVQNRISFFHSFLFISNLLLKRSLKVSWFFFKQQVIADKWELQTGSFGLNWLVFKRLNWTVTSH